MKRIIEAFLQMIYPSLISLFIFVFTTAFVNGESLETLQLITAILSILFGFLFVIGFLLNIVYNSYNNKKE